MGGCGAGTKDKGEEEGVVWSFTREGNGGGGGMNLDLAIKKNSR